MKLQRTALALALSAAGTFGIAIASPATAHAASVQQSAPGTPGAANCIGQTTAYVTQGNPNGYVAAQGIGNVAAANPGASVKDVNNLIAAFCAG
jgi:hypothetical protein